ncbi:MAG: D-serine ammonia-lyase [Oxalobacter sp.]|nr:MAG: D-serine ammonia-lyase [Oxalobacter sp.]
MSSFPFLPEAILRGEPTLWCNPAWRPSSQTLPLTKRSQTLMTATALRWQRFAGLLSRCFPESVRADGRIDSPLLEQQDESGETLWVKADHALPVTACIKARGGVYEVLCHAERLAMKVGLLELNEDYVVLADIAARQYFARHRILVGSTGNLGYSVGVIARALGFEVEVHMSRDAQEWKKQRLRGLGAQVVEHHGDFIQAVASAREIASQEARSYFIDDEDSTLLFFGYATAARDLQSQLKAAGVLPTLEKPLRVYLPCGVGGSPGGVALGLRCLYGDAVQCVFVEPVASPCFLLRLASGDDNLTVYDIGLNNQTVADGLAVPRAASTVARIVQPIVDAIITVDDASLLAEVRRQWHAYGQRLEPSAAAGFVAHRMAKTRWLDVGEKDVIPVVWTTGGNGLPDDVFLPLVANP